MVSVSYQMEKYGQGNIPPANGEQEEVMIDQ